MYIYIYMYIEDYRRLYKACVRAMQISPPKIFCSTVHFRVLNFPLTRHPKSRQTYVLIDINASFAASH